MGLLTWPFRAAFTLIGLVLGLLGSVLAAMIGIVMAGIGVVLCLSLVGAIVGVPLLLFGTVLFFKALF